MRPPIPRSIRAETRAAISRRGQRRRTGASSRRKRSAPGALLVHYSTDYVFDGTKRRRRTSRTTPTDPLNVYGATKLAGEQAIAAAGAHAL